MKKISYAITCCTELEELSRLIPFLKEHKRKEDGCERHGLYQHDAKASEVKGQYTVLP